MLGDPQPLTYEWALETHALIFPCAYLEGRIELGLEVGEVTLEFHED